MSSPVAPGAKLGRYRLEARLGAGGMGEVWKAHDEQLGRTVAVKLLRGSDADEIARFEREARLAARLSHPNIAAVYEVGAEDDRRFIAMQYIAGRTLRDLPRGNRRLLVQYVRDAALAVHAAHEHGIVHRDLKPANIMVEGRRVYVMDFGLAKNVTVQSSLTNSGFLLGTPSYMAPEQVQAGGAKVDARADVYGLGATLYDVLGGRAPFTGDNVYDLLLRVVSEEPAALPPDVDEALAAITMRCLSKDPARRPLSAHHLADELTAWLEGRRASARPKWRVAATVAAAVLLAGALAFLLMPPGRPPDVIVPDVAPRIEEARRALADAETCLYSADETDEKLARRLEDARRALESAPVNAEVKFLLGRAWEMSGREDLAEPCLRQSDCPEARLALAHLVMLRSISASIYDHTFGRAHSEVGLKLADEAAAECGNDAMMRALVEAVREYALGNDQAVLRLCTQGLQAFDGRRGAELFALLAATSTGAIERALEIRPRFALALFIRGTFRSSTSPAAAMSDYNAALRLNGRLVEAYVARAYLRREGGDFDGAIADADAALRIDPRRATMAYHNRATALHGRGDHDGAIRDFTELLLREPAYPYAWLGRAYAKRGKGDFDGAVADLSEILRTDSRNPTVLLERAYTHIVRGSAREGLEDAERVVAMSPTLEARMARAEAAVFLRENAIAEADIGEVLRTHPHYAYAYCVRANLRLGAGDRAGARADLEEALRHDPQIPLAYARRGVMRREDGDTAGAIEDLTRALRLAKPGWAFRSLIERELKALRP